MRNRALNKAQAIRPLNAERERRETALFDALGAVLRLPEAQAAPIAGFAAGLLASHLADVAAMAPPRESKAARKALTLLHSETGELLASLDEAIRARAETEAEAGPRTPRISDAPDCTCEGG